jgi:hypothetical protein
MARSMVPQAHRAAPRSVIEADIATWTIRDE